MFADPNIRLVTITGLGGMGKTRLALDIAWQHTEGQYRDGVTFVQLAALDSADFLVAAIAQALHLPLSVAYEHSATNQLLDYLKPKTAQLVLDNCERLLDGMVIANDILQAAPQVQILATSRERLGLRGEHVFTLHGLAYAEEQIDHAAARLVSSAAERALPDLEIDGDNAAYVNRFCRVVDGMPLALELAATWLNTMPTGTLVAEIEESLDFLAADLQNLPPRHHSLRAVLDSTWSHLKPETCQVFAALTVYQGSFSREAAQEITDASLSLLRQLVSHSLLEYDRDLDRYQLHEMLRQFAADKLAATPELERAAIQQHFVYYNDLAQRGGAAMCGGDQELWMARLELEQSNINRAID